MRKSDSARAGRHGHTSADVASIEEFVEGFQAQADERVRATARIVSSGFITAAAVTAYRSWRR